MRASTLTYATILFLPVASSARSNVARSLIAGGVVAGVVAGTALFKQFQELADDADILEREYDVLSTCLALQF